MREYIPKTWTYGNPAWSRTKGLIQDYDRIMRERQNILQSGRKPSDGMPRSTDMGRPSEDAALKLARLDDDIKAIDQASVEMRGRLSGKVRIEFDPVQAYWSYDYFNYQHTRKDDNDYGPSVRTWNRYKVAFMISVAQKAKII